MVVVGPTVPLSVLAQVSGTPFVVLEGDREDFTGLGSLPRSVRRLSIRAQSRPFSLRELPADSPLVELELDVTQILEGPPLPSLRTLGWKRMADGGARFVAAQPDLRELALRDASAGRLPPSRSLERILLFGPTGLPSLLGLDDLPSLRSLRLDHPKHMARLGPLDGAHALETLILVGAHAIADLGDLASLRPLDSVGVLETERDEAPFLALRGKLKAGSFQLASPEASRRLFAHLGVPYQTADLIADHFFDA